MATVSANNFTIKIKEAWDICLLYSSATVCAGLPFACIILLHLYHFPFRLYLKGSGSALKRNDARSNAVGPSATSLKIVRPVLKEPSFLSLEAQTQQKRNNPSRRKSQQCRNDVGSFGVIL